MKLALPESTVETSQQFEEQSFAIGDMAVIMEILRSKMYSNPIRTIVQEIGSNARDAHREAGIPELPFHVKLPSKLSPTFEMRDFGPGITPDRMANVFIRYGTSTKRADDRQTGGFGLGAKSPFAYTDTFCIESITPDIHFKDHENVLVKRSYVAFIDPTRIGKLNLLSEEVTTEPRGTKITVCCKPGDENSFAEHVKDIYHHWNRNGENRPEVTGCAGFAWHEPMACEFKDADWEIQSKEYGNGHVEAIIDGIPFPINKDDMGKDLDASLKAMFNKDIRIFVETGKLAITANREELDYKTAIEPITANLQRIRNAVKEQLQAKVKDCKNFWDASALWVETKKGYADIVPTVQWNGLDVSGDDISLNDKVGRAWLFQPSSGCRRVNRIEYNTKAIVVFDDTGNLRPPNGRIEALRRDYPGRHFLVVRWLDTTNLLDNPDLCQGTKDYLKEQLADVKDAHPEQWGAIRLSTIEPFYASRLADPSDPTSDKRKYKPMLKVRRFDPMTKSTSYVSMWQEVSVDEASVEKGRGLYVVLKDKTPYMKDANGHAYPVSQDTLRTLTTFVDEPVYGIQGRYAHRVGDGWDELGDVVRGRLRGAIKEHLLTLDDDDQYRTVPTLNNRVADLVALHGHGPLHAWVEKSKEQDVGNHRYNRLQPVALVLGMEAELTKAITKLGLKALMEKAMDKYPLLLYLRESPSYDKAEKKAWEKAICDYIK